MKTVLTFAAAVILAVISIVAVGLFVLWFIPQLIIDISNEWEKLKHWLEVKQHDRV